MNYNPFVRGITNMVENASYDEVSHTASPGEVRMTRVSRIVCAICTPFITALTVVFFLKEPVSWLHLACAALALVCLLGTLDCFVFRIRYNSTQFTVRNFFGITRTYTCAEVTGIHTAIFSVCIHVGKKVVRIPRDAAGLSRFCARLRRQYQRTHKTRLPCKETLFR